MPGAAAALTAAVEEEAAPSRRAGCTAGPCVRGATRMFRARSPVRAFVRPTAPAPTAAPDTGPILAMARGERQRSVRPQSAAPIIATTAATTRTAIGSAPAIAATIPTD